MTLPLGKIKLISEDPPLELTVLLGDGEIGVSGGSGGYSEIERPKRVSLTEWQGHTPRSMELPIILDGYVSDRSVEKDVATLQRMARKISDDARTPLITVEGKVPLTNVIWVINDISWESQERSIATGNRIRQVASISLLEYVEGELTVRRKKHPQKTFRLYTVKQGDTLGKIAAKLLGKASRWKEIKRLNPKPPIRDPNNLKRGRKLKVPVR